MIPKIIVFQGKHSKLLIERFREYGFEPLVDADHQQDLKWLNHNFKNFSHRFFKIGNYEGFECIQEIDKIDKDELFDFVLTFNELEKSNLNIWININHWVAVIVFQRPYRDVSFQELDEKIQRPYIEKVIVEEEEILEDHPSVPDSYGFRFKAIPEKGLCIYEVLKPHTDLPYTTIVRNWVDHKPFFSNLFVCKSWGVANTDLLFLKEAWKFLKMQGDCDLEKMVKERVESCLPPDPEPEPEVYRRSMEQVLEYLNDLTGNIDTGCMHSTRKRKVE